MHGVNSTRQPSFDFEALSVAATFLEHEHPTDAVTLLVMVHSIAGGFIRGLFDALTNWRYPPGWW